MAATATRFGIWVARDFEWWMAPRSARWADRCTCFGQEYRRLTPQMLETMKSKAREWGSADSAMAVEDLADRLRRLDEIIRETEKGGWDGC